MGLTRPITRELTQIIPRQLWRGLGLGKVKQILADARAALNIHPEQQTGSAYLVQKTPTLAGVVQDETPARKDRTRLSCRATSYDGINQYHRILGQVGTVENQAMSCAIWVRGEIADDKKFWSCYQSGVGGFRFYRLNATTWRFQTIDDVGVAATISITDSNFPLEADAWHRLAAVYDGADWVIYYDGRQAATGTSTLGRTSTVMSWGSNAGGSGSFAQCELQGSTIWQGTALTPAEIVSDYLGQYDDLPVPTDTWFHDGEDMHSLSGGLTPTVGNSPTLYEDDAVGGGDWLNEKGWNPVTKFDGDLITITDGLEVDFSKDVKIKMSVNYTTLSNSMELFEFAPNKNARTHFTTRLLWVLTGTGDVTTTGGDPTFTSDVWYDLEFDFVASSGTMTISVNDVVKATLAGQSPTTLQTLNNIGGGSTPLTALVSAFEVYEDNIKIFRLDGLVDSVGGLPLTIGAGISELNYPKRWDEELDSIGQPAANSESFGVARRDGQLVDGACLVFTGTEYATNANLVGTETITSSGGTSTPTVSAGRIDFTAGTCWGLTLSNGSIYPLGEGAGTAAYDVVNDEPLVLVNSPTWGNQSQYFWNENQGCSLYEHATSPDILVPFGSDGLALTITPPSGYTKTSDNPAGPWLYEGDETYVDFDVVANANQWLEQRWIDAEFDGATSKIELPNLLSIDRDVEVRLKFKADAWTSNQTLFCCNNGSSNRIGIVSHGGNIRVFFYDGTIALKASETATIGEEHEVYVKYKASTYELISATLDGVEMSGVATASVNSSTGSFLGINSTGAVWGSVGFYEGSIRGLVLHDNGVKVLDMPLLGASLDLSQVNHGTDTDITYNRLTDVSYTAGDVVEQPFSVNDDTSGRVSELVQFTFPVTTLSNTPTISQIVYEDGNTITEDSTLISEV